MTEELNELREALKKAEGHIRKLKKRLREKMKYEKAMLINAGSTPQYILEIEQRDQKALEG